MATKSQKSKCFKRKHHRANYGSTHYRTPDEVRSARAFKARAQLVAERCAIMEEEAFKQEQLKELQTHYTRLGADFRL